MTVYDLPPLHQRLAIAMLETAKAKYPEIETDIAVEFSPDDREHILLTVTVPAHFYDSQEGIDFGRFTGELTADAHIDTGVWITLMERYAGMFA